MPKKSNYSSWGLFKGNYQKKYVPYTVYYSNSDIIGVRRSDYIRKLFKAIREHQTHIQHLRLVLKRLYLIKKISEVEYSQKDKLFLTKHKNLQNLIKKETISIEYCQKQTLYLKRNCKIIGNRSR